MVVATTTYGNRITHVGTLAEVMAAMGGIPHGKIIAMYYDTTLGKHVAVVRTQ